MVKRAGDVRRADRAAQAGRPPIGAISLEDPRARNPGVAGAKAAALATAMAGRLPVIPGAVLCVGGDPAGLRPLWEAISDGGATPVAVRSSSPVEDQATSSMAGQFTSVLDVSGWPATVAAVDEVRASAPGAPMAVLVQPMCPAAIGGVLFGADPVTGRADHLLVEVVPGTPNALVSGQVTASRSVLTRRGRFVETDGRIPLDRRARRRLASLARHCARVFGGPQDIEWAIDGSGRLWLLQSRPITATAAPARGPRLGPGPVAETFPDPLAPLELDLWVEPLRAGIREALRLAGVHPSRVIDRSPVLVEVDGRVAADLDLLEGRARGRIAALIDPRPGARRLVAAWRVGRLRHALPHLAADLVEIVDGELSAVPNLAEVDDDRELLAIIGSCRLAARAVHGHEVLAGALGDDGGGSSIGLAAQAVAAGRRAGFGDAEVVLHDPVVLALVPPRIGPMAELPAAPAPAAPVAELGPREALRLRARWLQELSSRAAAALGDRLAAAGRLTEAADVRWLRLDELAAIVLDGAAAPGGVHDRAIGEDAAPLPTVFRLAGDGTVVVEPGALAGAGRGAGGGRGLGTVADAHDDRPGTVLVVQALEPGLAGRLAGRAGLVAETGSALSHLAILARELGVPTVVGVPDAIRRFPPGTVVLVDGVTGQVEVQQ